MHLYYFPDRLWWTNAESRHVSCRAKCPSLMRLAMPWGMLSLCGDMLYVAEASLHERTDLR